MDQKARVVEGVDKDGGEETKDKKNPLTFTFSYHFVFWLFTRCFTLYFIKTSCK